MKWTVGSKIGAGFALALALFVTVGVVSYGSARAADASLQWVKHSDDVSWHLAAVRGLVTDVETARRGYVITGKESYLAPYRTAADSIGRSSRRPFRHKADIPVAARSGSLATRLPSA